MQKTDNTPIPNQGAKATYETWKPSKGILPEWNLTPMELLIHQKGILEDDLQIAVWRGDSEAEKEIIRLKIKTVDVKIETQNLKEKYCK